MCAWFAYVCVGLREGRQVLVRRRVRGVRVCAALCLAAAPTLYKRVHELHAGTNKCEDDEKDDVGAGQMSRDGVAWVQPTRRAVEPHPRDEVQRQSGEQLCVINTVVRAAI